MFHSKSQICVEQPEKQTNIRNTQFIQTIREEDRRDKILEDVFMRSTEENPYHKQISSTIEICSEIKEDARQRFLEQKRRQQLRENNQELKLLEAQLRAAYVKKAVSAQIFEKEAIKNEDKVRLHHYNTALEQARLRSEEAEKKREDEERLKKAELKSDLQEQIAWSNAIRMKKYEQMLKDKEMIEEVIKKCREDKKREENEALERKLRIKAEMEEFKQAQEKCKMVQNQAAEDENKRISELIRQREIDEQMIAEEKRNQRRRKEEISEKIGKRIQAIKAEEAKNRECLVELLIEERQAKEEIQLRKELERQVQSRTAARLDLERDLQEKEQRKMIKKKIDEQFFQEEMRILAERDKLEQLSDEKRRRKQMEHRRELQECLDVKKQKQAEQMRQFLRVRETELAEIKRNDQLVEEERIEMIKAHASNLKGYLAPGVLRESDRQFLPTPPKQN